MSSFFSRLTDIVTCNLSEILASQEDPHAAIEQIIYEIQEGVAGAFRSLNTASKNADKIEEELKEHAQQAESLAAQAKEALVNDEEEKARSLLLRKSEQQDLVAGLEQQLESARNLVNHLQTTQRALEARLHDAQRKQQQLLSGELDLEETAVAAEEPPSVEPTRNQEIEDELAAMKRELGRE